MRESWLAWSNHMSLFGRKLRMLTAAAVLLIWSGLLSSHVMSAELHSGGGNVGFWIGTDNNEVLDGQVLRLISKHAGFVVVNAHLDNTIPEYRYGAVVARLKSSAHGVPVLAYVTPTSWFHGQSRRLAGAILDGFPNLGELLLHDANGKQVYADDGKLLFADVRKSEYRSWLVNNVKHFLAQLPNDGIAFDVIVRTPVKRQAALCKADPNFCPEYALGIDELFMSLRQNLAGKVLLFNGLFGLYDGELEDQLKLMKYVNATAIEYFGMFPEQGITKPMPFRIGVLPFLGLAEEYPGKVIMFFGRGPQVYTDYREDYLWQRYLYASYLLGAGTNTLFKFLASFSVPPHAGRAGGLDIYADWDSNLGRPTGRYQSKGGVYFRRFEKGLVLVAPHDETEKKYILDKPVYSPEGERFSGAITLRPGEGLILTYSAASVPRPVTVDLQAVKSGWIGNSWSSIISEARHGTYLSLERTPSGYEWAHDILLDPVRDLNNSSFVRLRLRSNDPAAKVFLVAEVDDKQRIHKTVVFELAPAGQQTGLRAAPRIPYRMIRGAGNAPYVPLKAAFPADSTWHEIVVDGNQALQGQSYTFRRWSHLRPVGNIDLSSVQVLKDHN